VEEEQKQCKKTKNILDSLAAVIYKNKCNAAANGKNLFTSAVHVSRIERSLMFQMLKSSLSKFGVK